MQDDRGEHGLKNPIARLGISLIDDFLRHTLTADLFNVFQQPLTES